MTDEKVAATAAYYDARDSRRWQIGIAISIFFGIFGCVMAYLSYSERTAPPAARSGSGAAAAPVVPATPAAITEPARGHGKHGR